MIYSVKILKPEQAKLEVEEKGIYDDGDDYDESTARETPSPEFLLLRLRHLPVLSFIVI
jgi:hypothetical protein